MVLARSLMSFAFVGNRELVLEFDYADGEDFQLVTPFVAETDRWYHFAFTFDDATGEATIYVDGEALATGVAPEPLLFTGRNAQVGQGSGGFATFATIDNYRIWNVARSAAEIQEGLGRQFEDNDQIVLDYRFEDDNTASVFDHSSFGNTGFLTPVGTRPIPVPGLANVGIHSFTIGVEDGRGGIATQRLMLRSLRNFAVIYPEQFLTTPTAMASRTMVAMRQLKVA